MKLHIAICDDEPLILADTKGKIRNLRPDYMIDVYPCAEQLLASLQTYDMIFLDIELPGLDGISTAKELRKNKYTGHIVFLTSHTEFMPEAFKVKAFRFLKKPIPDLELKEALIESEKELLDDKKIIVTDYGSEIVINISEILYIEATKNKTKLHFRTQTIQTNNTLKYWIQELGTMNFFQVHKSYFVSLKYIQKIDDGKIILHYTNVELPISRRKMVAVRNAFFSYIKANAKYI